MILQHEAEYMLENSPDNGDSVVWNHRVRYPEHAGRGPYVLRRWENRAKFRDQDGDHYTRRRIQLQMRSSGFPLFDKNSEVFEFHTEPVKVTAV
jgi:hypothetical protein